MPNDNLKKLYDKIVSDGYDMPDYPTFQKDMLDTNNLKKLYNNLNVEYSLPDFKTFQTDMGIGDQQTPNPFPICAQSKGSPKTTTKGTTYIEYKTNLWDQPTIFLYTNGRFKVSGGSNNNKMGTYKCTGTGKLFLSLDENNVTPSGTPTGNTQNKNVAPKKAFFEVKYNGNDIANGKTVGFGMYGEIVKTIQKLLLDKGFKNISKSGNIDGRYGIRTYNSVKQFQQKTNLKVDVS